MKHIPELVRVVNSIDPAKLNMEVWKCGTKACIAGHCAEDPYFQSQGLELFQCERIGRDMSAVRDAAADMGDTLTDVTFGSLGRLFDISYLAAMRLFGFLDDGAHNKRHGQAALDEFKHRLITHLGYNPWVPRHD